MLQTNDVRKWLRTYHLSHSQLAMKMGIMDNALHEVLTCCTVPDEYEERVCASLANLLRLKAQARDEWMYE